VPAVGQVDYAATRTAHSFIELANTPLVAKLGIRRAQHRTAIGRAECDGLRPADHHRDESVRAAQRQLDSRRGSATCCLRIDNPELSPSATSPPSGAAMTTRRNHRCASWRARSLASACRCSQAGMCALGKALSRKTAATQSSALPAGLALAESQHAARCGASVDDFLESVARSGRDRAVW